jgi:hypothetical protein
MKLVPQTASYREMFASNAALSEVTALRNGSAQVSAFYQRGPLEFGTSKNPPTIDEREARRVTGKEQEVRLKNTSKPAKE